MIELVGKIISWLPWTNMGNCQNTIQLRQPQIPELRFRERGDIPRRIRDEVWKQWSDDQSSPRCFCCDNILNKDTWHCGHILSRTHGASPYIHNLRPLCPTCNLSMGNRHMFEYIILQNLPGKRHIRQSPLYPYFRAKKKILRDIEQQIRELVKNKRINKTQANKLHRLSQNKGERWMEVIQLLQTYK